MTDLWQYLKAAADNGRPILLYGMGNGADKILAICRVYDIPVADFFASDGFVRGHSFHGKIVLSFGEVCQRYKKEDMIVLLAFASSRPEVLETIRRVADTCELYVPDVPVCGTEVFNAAFYESHLPRITAARDCLTDEESRRVFDRLIEYKLTGRMQPLLATQSSAAEAYQALLPAHRFRTVLDLGAYNGDSIRELRGYAPALERVIALEPDRRSFRKLKAYADGLQETGDPLRVLAYPLGAWSHTTTLDFHDKGNRNAGLLEPAPLHTGGILPPTDQNPYFGKATPVPVTSVDRITEEALGRDTPVDFIKYDVEGAEAEALRGSRMVLKAHALALLVSIYHRSEDLFELPLLVKELNPAYRLYLRRMVGVPAWDINLYAVAE